MFDIPALIAKAVDKLEDKITARVCRKIAGYLTILANELDPPSITGPKLADSDPPPPVPPNEGG